MAYTVKQVAALSGVSVRTLHFYDETGLLKPASYGANGYRLYEEPQLLRLQQILFYRELGFELKKIKEVLDREDFEKVAALESHREVLLQDLARTRRLLETIEKTIEHLKGARKMQVEEMFAGFRVAAGDDRFGEHITLGELGETNDCKVSARDTNGVMCIFEFSGVGGGPLHRHREQDEWVYVLEGACSFEAGAERVHLTAGESIFIPRMTPHVWGCALGTFCKILNVYSPAGNMEEFFRQLSSAQDLPTVEDALNNRFTETQVEYFDRLLDAHGMDLLGPGLIVD